jgi:tRNA-modifying protein YgfZ
MSDNTTRSFPEVGSVEDEFTAAITSAAIVDRSRMGKLLVTGADRLDLLHRLSTNDLLDLKPFSARMTVFTTNKGRIVDYVKVLVFSDSLMLITSPGQESQLMSWIDKYTVTESIQIKAVTSAWAIFSLVGPEAQVKAGEMLGHLPESDSVVDLEFVNTAIKVNYQRDFSICAVNILVPSEHAPIVLGQLTKAGKEMGIATMSTQGYECFRIFHGIPREECELTSEFNPLEAGLVHAISWTKGCYIGQEVIARLDTYQKIHRKLVRLSFNRFLPDFRYPLPLSKDGEKVGILSSFAPAHLNGAYHGLGIVRQERVIRGDTLSAVTHLNETEGIVTEIFDRNLR